MSDEIIRELWHIKDEIARKHDYDLEALVAHLREEQSKSKRVALDRQSTLNRAEGDAAGDADEPRP